MDGLYGTTRPAIVRPETDVEIFYSYKKDRSFASIEGERFEKADDIRLFPAKVSGGNDGGTINLDGMYNLKLPVGKFSKKGIYTIYIRPKRILTKLTDVSVLFSYPDVRGMVFDVSKDEFGGISNLTGYRVDFLDSAGNNNGNSRLITSCDFCTPKKTSVDDKYSEDIRYVFSANDGKLVFCTVTPSLANSFKPNALPYIGESNLSVAVSNTNFNPAMIEIEMVEHDIDTLSYMLEGSQVRDLDKGKIITFNDNNEIYSVHENFTLKDKLGNPLYDVKVKKDNLGSDGTKYKDLIKE